MRLYSYWRSSTSYRVRIALNLKGIPHEIIPVDLKHNQQMQSDFQMMNASKSVPVLVHHDVVITQSTAIIEYLEDIQPRPALLHQDHLQRAFARSIGQMIACDIHPLNNLRVLRYLEDLSVDEKTRLAWYHHWMKEGFQSLEMQLQNYDGPYALGQDVGYADVFLVPQVYNALRYDFCLGAYPRILNIYKNCEKIEAFKKAAPEQQRDANQ